MRLWLARHLIGRNTVVANARMPAPLIITPVYDGVDVHIWGNIINRAVSNGAATEPLPPVQCAEEETKLSSDVYGEPVWIDFTNHRGERRIRHIVPIRIFFGSTKWHEGWQWLLEAYDTEKQEGRCFPVVNIHRWYRTAPQPSDDAAMTPTT